MIGAYGAYFLAGEYKPRVLKKEYVEYGTVKSIADVWDDPEHIGECAECGMSDSAVIRTIWGQLKCKFCMELSNLNYHLKYNGSRRKTNAPV